MAMLSHLSTNIITVRYLGIKRLTLLSSPLKNSRPTWPISPSAEPRLLLQRHGLLSPLLRNREAECALSAYAAAYAAAVSRVSGVSSPL